MIRLSILCSLLFGCASLTRDSGPDSQPAPPDAPSTSVLVDADVPATCDAPGVVVHPDAPGVVVHPDASPPPPPDAGVCEPECDCDKDCHDGKVCHHGKCVKPDCDND